MSLRELWGINPGLRGFVTLFLPFCFLVLLIITSIDSNGDAIPFHRRRWRRYIGPLPLCSIFAMEIFRASYIPWNYLGLGVLVAMFYLGGLMIYDIMAYLERRSSPEYRTKKKKRKSHYAINHY